MTIFVDGYNFFFTGIDPTDRGENIERAREMVIDAMTRFHATRNADVIVFFDGGPAGSHMPRVQRDRGIEIRFSDPGRDADRDIMRAVSHWHNPSELRVITSDREIVRFVARFGAAVTSSQDFAVELRELEKEEDAIPPGEPVEKYEPPEKPSRNEVDFWLREFLRDDRKK